MESHPINIFITIILAGTAVVVIVLLVAVFPLFVGRSAFVPQIGVLDLGDKDVISFCRTSMTMFVLLLLTLLCLTYNTFQFGSFFLLLCYILAPLVDVNDPDSTIGQIKVLTLGSFNILCPLER